MKYHSRIVPIPINEVMHFIHQTRHPRFKGVIGMSKYEIIYMNQEIFISNPLTFTKEAFTMIPQVVYAVKHFYLLEEINKLLGKFKDGGLIQHWQSEIINTDRTTVEVSSPEVLKIDQFFGSFLILAIGSIVSFFVFVFEHLKSKKI